MAKVQVLECVLISLGFTKVQVRPYHPGLKNIGDITFEMRNWPGVQPYKDVLIGEVYDRMKDVTWHAELRCPLETEVIYISPRLHGRGEMQAFRDKVSKILGQRARVIVDNSTYAEPCPHSIIAIDPYNVEVR
jgi:hypothetical protein